MKLEEAKLYLEHTGEYDFNLEKHQAQNRKEAIETVLQALDNSISKDKVEEMIKQLDYGDYTRLEYNYRKKVLQELLGD